MTVQDDNPNRNTDPSAQTLIAGYVLGDLSPEELSAVQQYLADHPEARAEVAALQATLNLLPLSLSEDATPPAALQAQLLEAAAITPQEQRPAIAASASDSVSTPTTSIPTPQPRSPEQHPTVQPAGQTKDRTKARFGIRPITLGAIAAAIAAAVLGFQNFQLRSNLRFAQQQSERLASIEAQLISAKAEVAEYQEMLTMLRLPENRLLALSGSNGFTETSSGSVVIAPQENWAMLTLQNLPTPPPGKAYQLWAMANGEKVYCAEFKPGEAGQVLLKIPVGGWAGTPMVSITLEDEGTIPTETSEMLMNGTVI